MAFVTWHCAVTSLLSREQVVFVSVCPSHGGWAGRSCRTRPLCPCALLGWLPGHPFPSPCRAGMEPWPGSGQAPSSPTEQPQQNPLPWLHTFPAHGLGCTFQLSHRSPQIFATGSCRTCRDLFLLLIPAWTSAGLRAADPTPNTHSGCWDSAGGAEPGLGETIQLEEPGGGPGWVGECVGAREESSPCGSQVAPRGAEPPLP